MEAQLQEVGRRVGHPGPCRGLTHPSSEGWGGEFGPRPALTPHTGVEAAAL